MSTYTSDGFHASKQEGHVQIRDADGQRRGAPEAGDETPFQTLKNRVLDAIEKYWLFEFFGWTLALGCFIGAVSLLAVHSGRESPNWTLTVGAGRYHKTFGLTVNTVISIFATAFSSGILIPVAASINQLKWVWFQRGRRPLAHFQKFESAARGPLGSIMLLWTLRCRRLACIGAVIVLAALGVGFSFQALVVYPLRAVAVGTSAIQRTNNEWQPISVTTEVPGSVIGAVYSGIFQYSSVFSNRRIVDAPQMKVSCSTGNCTWHETYTSMSLCTQCHEISASIRSTCGTAHVPWNEYYGKAANSTTTTMPVQYCNYTLPNGLEVSGLPSTNFTQFATSSNVANSPHFHADTTVSVLSVVTTVWRASNPTPEYGTSIPMTHGIFSKAAMECGIYYCVQKFNTAVSNGTLDERVIDTYATGRYSTVDNAYVLEPPSSFTNVSTRDDPSANVYSTPNFLSIKQFFSTFWQGNCSVTEAGSANPQSPCTSQMALLLIRESFGTYPAILSRLAKAMSYAMRLQSTPETQPAALGVAYQHKPHVKVRWAWLALPASLLGLALVLLVATIVITAREKTLLWKGSSLAAFSHPLTSDARAAVSEATSPRDVVRVAEKIEVKWEPTDSGFRLVRSHEA
ncbi:hypothetical protein CLCR_01868 [Cladophialophora carrionii]|uniref:Uncharacterized protein n=1 Tax=Cladophialophora carrionii TaxID=86049 RepID=A0A1C1CDQ7_9EURO|nr:hypothetical protein CLCR_01868 [Cladophialophora carrionii]